MNECCECHVYLSIGEIHTLLQARVGLQPHIDTHLVVDQTPRSTPHSNDSPQNRGSCVGECGKVMFHTKAKEIPITKPACYFSVSVPINKGNKSFYGNTVGNSVSSNKNVNNE